MCFEGNYMKLDSNKFRPNKYENNRDEIAEK